jgi:16S rRNA processing protein RimM
VKDRPTADTLREKYLEVPTDRESLPADTWYWHDIVGCAVTTDSGVELGTVREVFRVGESEVYVVVGDRGETLVPAVAAVVTKLDPPNRQIVVNGAALGIAG